MTSYERYSQLAITKAGRIATVTLNRPDRLNAIDEGFHHELSTIFFDLADDEEINVIVLTGAGRAFCGGGDLHWLKEKTENTGPFIESVRQGRDIVMGILDCPKPIICRMNGDAVGLGATVALLCDMIIAVDTARISDPHVRIGLVAGDGGALIWPQLVGFAKAKEFLLTGNAVDAVEAARINLINYAVKAEELDATVAKFAERMATNAQSPMRYTKFSANIPLRQMVASVLESSLAYEGLTMLQNDDLKEGVDAFLSGRRPKFAGT